MPEAPDFAGAWELSLSERLLIRSFVVAVQGGEPPPLLLDETDMSCIAQGPQTAEFARMRLVRIRDAAADVLLRDALDRK